MAESEIPDRAVVGANVSGELLDVAVVGAGVSGVYVAWRWLTHQAGKVAKEGKEPAPRITVFEQSDRVGGRLLSVTPPGIGNMTAELGGMRFLPTNQQPRINKLIEKLNEGLGHDERIETYPFTVDEDDNILYLRGIHLRRGDIKNRPREVPYRLSFLERGKAPTDIVGNALDQIVPGVTYHGLTEDQRRQRAQEACFDGKRLYKQGLWEVLVRVISGEAYQLAVATGGYDTTLANWNAADAIPWYVSDFLTSAYRGFRKGFQQVPLTLAKRIRQAGGQIECHKKLKGFEVKDGTVELCFCDGSTARARKLVLAMPRRSLELLAPGSCLLRRPAVERLVRSVTPRPLIKLFTTYSYAWWTAAGVKAGRTTTDLPVRQTYYWPQDDGSPATAADRAMLMASFDDGLNVGFWDGFRPPRRRSSRPDLEERPEKEWFKGSDLAPKDKQWLANPAPVRMVEEVQRQLAVIHDLQFTPKVVDACFKDWGDDPFGGGWNSWNIGVESATVQKSIIKPAADHPVYICGEAYSDAQGWVEGALQTADRVLEKLGVPQLIDG
jgi:monoamine oxidase